MYKDCCIVILLFSFLYSCVIFCCGGEKHVAAGVESCLHAVLDYANDEAYGYGLHGDVIAYIEE